MGRLPNKREVRSAWKDVRRFVLPAGAQDDSTIIQPAGYLMDQKQLPSCVGKSWQGRLNGLLGIDISGVNLWIESRSYDGSLLDASSGTYGESAIEILLENGWTARINQYEDSISPSSPILTELPTLQELMSGDDNRMASAIEHQTFVGSDDAIHFGILQALREKDSNGQFVNAISFGTGVFEKFFNPPENKVLDETYLSESGNVGGHEQGLLGWVKERNGYLIQGSWNDWTRCTVNGLVYPGCCLVSRGVVEHAWAVDKMRVR
jgi:hypothetical protein